MVVRWTKDLVVQDLDDSISRSYFFILNYSRSMNLVMQYLKCPFHKFWFISQMFCFGYLISVIDSLQAFDWVFPFPFPDHIYCNEGSKGCWSSFSTTTWGVESWFAQIARMPSLVTQHAWSSQTKRRVEKHIAFNWFASIILKMACHGPSIQLSAWAVLT